MRSARRRGLLNRFFTPLDLNPALWLDAADLSTITASGSPLRVSQWDNKGSLGNFTQSSGAVQPTTGASTLNGLNILDFAGNYVTAVNQNEWKFLHDGTEWIMGAVWQAGTTANPTVVYGLIGSNGGSSLAHGFSFVYDDRALTSSNDAIAVQISRNVLLAFTAFMAQANNQNVHPANTPVTVTLRARPSEAVAADRLLAQINTDTPRQTNTSTNAPSTANPTHALQIGSSGGNAIPVTGKIAEVVIVSGANATEANRIILRDYLATKWGI